MQLVIRRILERLGYSVVVVDNGGEALRAYSQHPFDLVFLDVEMPVMDGYDAARAIRALPPSPDRLAAITPVPIIGLSAFGQDSERALAIKHGMNACLIKPIRLKAIAGIINSLGLQTSTSAAAKIGPTSKAIVPSSASSRLQHDTHASELAIDRAALFSMTTAFGRDGCIAAVDQFARDVQRALGVIETFSAAGDIHGIRKTAHRLKGLFGQFGAPVASRLAAEIEAIPDDGSHAGLVARLCAIGMEVTIAVRNGIP